MLVIEGGFSRNRINWVASFKFGYEERRRMKNKARKIEAQLYEQMHSYRSTKSDGAESDLEAGIDLLLRQLQQVNAQMQAWVPSRSHAGKECMLHFLIDTGQDLRTKQEHALLLEDVKEFDRARLDLETGDGSTDQALLNEHVGINRNTAYVIEILRQ
ncbi:hypothetical protein Bca4012_102157 [Brassica carinata]